MLAGPKLHCSSRRRGEGWQRRSVEDLSVREINGGKHHKRAASADQDLPWGRGNWRKFRIAGQQVVDHGLNATRLDVGEKGKGEKEKMEPLHPATLQALGHAVGERHGADATSAATAERDQW